MSVSDTEWRVMRLHLLAHIFPQVDLSHEVHHFILKSSLKPEADWKWD